MAVLLSPPSKNAVQKTLSAQLLNTAGNGDPISFDDVDGIPNLPGVLVINRVDSNGAATPAKREYIEYSGTSGSTVLITTRNVDGSNSALTHAVGSIVEFIPDVTWADRIYDALANVVDISDLSAKAASTTAVGSVEIATGAETTTGTDATRAVSPDGLAGSDYGKRVTSIIVFDDATDVETGDGAGDIFYRVPSVINGYNLVGVAAQVQTAGTTGTTDIQIHNVTQTADMLSTKITIDSGETDSSTAATPAVIDTANDDVATGDQIRIDVDAVSTTAPKGLLVELIWQLP